MAFYEKMRPVSIRIDSGFSRLRMLELYGKAAVSWTIDSVERKKASVASQDGQLALDFRPPKPERKRAKKKEYW